MLEGEVSLVLYPQFWILVDASLLKHGVYGQDIKIVREDHFLLNIDDTI